jgi:hypothetical protein
MADDPKEYNWGGEDDEQEPRPSRPPLRPVPSPLERLKALESSPAAAVPEPARVISLPARLPEPEPEEPAAPASSGTGPDSKGGAAETEAPDRRGSYGRPTPASAAPSQAEGSGEEEVKGDEPFDRPGAEKLGILGGKGVGKSYLFQAMVYRTLAGQQSGALTYYLEQGRIRLFTERGEKAAGEQVRNFAKTGTARTLNPVTFVKKYQTWQRLSFTSKEAQIWYRLRLLYRTGWLGRNESALDVEFFDGSGEGFFQLPTVDLKDRELWDRAYLNARVMVFCLPLWAAFPGNDLTDEEWDYREDVIEGFRQVMENYRDMRDRHNQKMPVISILALTMSDDRRSALRTLYDRWISPYMDSSHTYLKQLRKGKGIAQYLANARKVSEALHEEFGAARDPRVTSIPQSLDFRAGKPWIVALSAIEGDRLEELENKFSGPDDPARIREARKAAPVPVHVELPLLVALCERENALM